MSNAVGGRPFDLGGRELMIAVLMIPVRIAGGLAYHEAIEEMDRELTKVTEDFMRAVDVETLRVAKGSGEH